jgi:hypothetical protein
LLERQGVGQLRVFISRIHICVISDANLARSIIENKCWEGLDRILRLKESTKASSFLRVRPHGSSISQSYGHLKKKA